MAGATDFKYFSTTLMSHNDEYLSRAGRKPLVIVLCLKERFSQNSVSALYNSVILVSVAVSEFYNAEAWQPLRFICLGLGYSFRFVVLLDSVRRRCGVFHNVEDYLWFLFVLRGVFFQTATGRKNGFTPNFLIANITQTYVSFRADLNQIW